jgi:hypothetical protein
VGVVESSNSLTALVLIIFGSNDWVSLNVAGQGHDTLVFSMILMKQYQPPPISLFTRF